MEGLNKSEEIKKDEGGQEKMKSLEFGGKFYLTANDDGKTYYAVYHNALGGSNMVPNFDPGIQFEELENISKKEAENPGDDYLPETVELIKKMLDENLKLKIQKNSKE